LLLDRTGYLAMPPYSSTADYAVSNAPKDWPISKQALL
jgi:hypothetical protein